MALEVKVQEEEDLMEDKEEEEAPMALEAEAPEEVDTALEEAPGEDLEEED